MTEQLDSAICIAAQLWCKPKHQHKVMDPDLCVDIAAAIRSAVKEARAGLLRQAGYAYNHGYFKEWWNAETAKAKEPRHG